MKKTVTLLGLIIGLLTSCTNDDGGNQERQCNEDNNGDGIINITDCYNCLDLNNDGFITADECF